MNSPLLIPFQLMKKRKLNQDLVKIAKMSNQNLIVLYYVLTFLEYFSNIAIKDLNINENTQKAIDGLGFKTLTEIQARSIPHILNGRDVLG